MDAEKIISEADQGQRLAALPQTEVRLLFPARLVPEKGSDTVLAAIKKLEQGLLQDAPQVSVDIIGEGPLLETCKDFAATYEGRVKVRVLDPVSYPVAFFALLRDYHAILLANRHHEQPRVVYDSFSQGVPVISSATDGVAEIVTADADALLYDVEDADGLAKAIVRLAIDPDLLQKLSMNARKAAEGNTHKAMHETRAAFFEDTLPV